MKDLQELKDENLELKIKLFLISGLLEHFINKKKLATPIEKEVWIHGEEIRILKAAWEKIKDK